MERRARGRCSGRVETSDWVSDRPCHVREGHTSSQGTPPRPGTSRHSAHCIRIRAARLMSDNRYYVNQLQPEAPQPAAPGQEPFFLPAAGSSRPWCALTTHPLTDYNCSRTSLLRPRPPPDRLLPVHRTMSSTWSRLFTIESCHHLNSQRQSSKQGFSSRLSRIPTMLSVEMRSTWSRSFRHDSWYRFAQQ